MSGQLRRLQAAGADGRAQNARFAQNQLKRLFDVLVENKTPVKVALRNDTLYTAAEVDAEYYLTLENIRESYKSINNAKILENEYSVAKLRDNPTQRIPVGCVYIVPTRHTPLYAMIAPLCAAIVAGNCVAIEVRAWQSHQRFEYRIDRATVEANAIRTQFTLAPYLDGGSQHGYVSGTRQETGQRRTLFVLYPSPRNRHHYRHSYRPEATRLPSFIPGSSDHRPHSRHPKCSTRHRACLFRLQGTLSLLARCSPRQRVCVDRFLYGRCPEGYNLLRKASRQDKEQVQPQVCPER